MKAAIEFAGVTKVYKHVFREERVAALQDVSFSVAPGEVCAFLGPNGAGKTTGIGLVMGFLFQDSGEVRVLDHRPGDIRAKAQIGFLPENFAFYRFLTGPKLLALHVALSGRQVNDANALIRSLLHQVKLAGYESLRIGRYSRGMAQRLGIAQALVADPQLLILDEPTSGLDPTGRKEVLDLVRSLKDNGKTVFLSSHILSDVEQICDRAVIVNRGRVVRSGSLDAILRSDMRVEIVPDQLSEEAERSAVECGAEVHRDHHGVRLLIDVSGKRQLIETLWAAQCDIVRVNPLKDSLEDVFHRLVGGPS